MMTERISDSNAGTSLRALSSSPSTAQIHNINDQALKPIIAVDLDDVLCQTNVDVAEWHNQNFGTQMTTADFHYYHYWKNPFWGSPSQTANKVRDYYAGGSIYSTKLVDGALEGIRRLKALGYRLVVVTARYDTQLDHSWNWIEKYFPSLFESIICIGKAAETVGKGGHEVITKLSKAEVCQQLDAVLIIDDSLDNALQCASFSHPTPAILFGDYEWNKRPSYVLTDKDRMSYDERFELEGKEWWLQEKDEIPEGAPIWRATNWEEVIKHVERIRKDMQ